MTTMLRRSGGLGPLRSWRRPSCTRLGRHPAKSYATVDGFPQEATSDPATAALNPRWLSDLQRRVGKCILFGLKGDQAEEAGRITEEMALNWRELLAGLEGFLTSKHRRGLFRQAVVWGEMV